MIIYIVSSRYGCEMNAPAVFKTMESARSYITETLAQCVIDEFSSELDSDGIDVEDNDAVLKWASDHDYVDTYNTDIYDTFTYSDDWTEFRIDESIV